MAGTLKDLASDIRKLRLSLPAASSKIACDVALAIETDLLTVTPVDTGQAMSNWVVTLNTPSPENIDAYNPSPRGKMIGGMWTHSVPPPITRAANISEALAEAQATLASKQPGETIFITNNLPYIEALDTGSSLQQPAGFYDRALIVGNSVLETAQLVI